MGGSIKRRIVNPELIRERARCSFDKEEAQKVLFTEDMLWVMETFNNLIAKHPQIKTSPEYYEMTREEKFKEWWERYRIIMADPEFRYLITDNSHKKSKYFDWYYLFGGSSPMTLHMTMFTKSVIQLGSEE